MGSNAKQREKQLENLTKVKLVHALNSDEELPTDVRLKMR